MLLSKGTHDVVLSTYYTHTYYTCTYTQCSGGGLTCEVTVARQLTKKPMSPRHPFKNGNWFCLFCISVSCLLMREEIWMLSDIYSTVAQRLSVTSRQKGPWFESRGSSFLSRPKDTQLVSVRSFVGVSVNALWKTDGRPVQGELTPKCAVTGCSRQWSCTARVGGVDGWMVSDIWKHSFGKIRLIFFKMKPYSHFKISACLRPISEQDCFMATLGLFWFLHQCDEVPDIFN